ncbi:MAG: hypothetical protein P4M01_05230 [Acidobacteriota bacterium]|nr:hypothetical protein [Acidobacteriota bacterium]
MKRSQSITLGLLTGMALAFTSGCRSTPQHRDCVDANNHVINNKDCEDADDLRRRGYGGGFSGYHWLYGGSSGGHMGDSVFGGSATPSGGASGFFGGISRGGFGGTGASGAHGGGSGGE